ncbi:MAG: hypothetical protein KVP17_004019 [Porospora cf. gigantea B]|uniref:uncharacterized protein n=1 Tax=Porospora cf. gigantea B TaxID=2853592 RepID=UPI003571C084|nr:MAG: hypothetical protein KVP17_004019 [Porospora cf. gigantea B]
MINDIKVSDLRSLVRELQQADRRSRYWKLEAFVRKARRLAKDDESLFPLVRCLLPQLDRHRTYGLKEVSLGKLYSKALTLGKVDHERLRYWKNPQKIGGYGTPGDLPSVIAAVIHKKIPQSQAVGADCGEHADPRVNSEDHEFIGRVILQDMKLGLSVASVLRMLSPKCAEAFDTSFDLETAVNAYRKDDEVEHETHSRMLNKPIRPMLAKPLMPERAERDLWKAEEPEGYVVEPKWDGERMLVHGDWRASPIKSGELEFHMRLFSRSGNETTELYSSSIRDAVESSVRGRQFILDGELVAWDTAACRLHPFGHNKTAARGEVPGVTLKLFVFDLLFHWAGDEQPPLYLQRYPLKQRRQYLERVLVGEAMAWDQVGGYNPGERVVCLTPQLPVESGCGLTALLNACIARKEEGLVIKAVDSKYRTGSRSAGWFKLKPPTGCLPDTLDLLVVGAFLSEGRRRHTSRLSLIDHCSHFLLACKSPDCYVSFATVGTGYTTSELDALRDILRSNVRTLDGGYPSWLDRGPEFSQVAEKPDLVAVSPESAVVMEVVAAEIVPSTKYGASFTLRFPRCVPHGVRQDKTPDEVLSLEDLKALQKSTMDDRPWMSDDDEQLVSFKRQKQAASATTIRVLQAHTRQPNQSAETSPRHEHHPFLDREFWVSGPHKRENEDLIESVGGLLSQNYRRGLTQFVVSDKPGLKVKAASKRYDLVVYSGLWLRECVRSGSVLAPSPLLVSICPPDIQATWKRTFDMYGLPKQVSPELLKVAMSVSTPQCIEGWETLSSAVDVVAPLVVRDGQFHLAPREKILPWAAAVPFLRKGLRLAKSPPPLDVHGSAWTLAVRESSVWRVVSSV